MINPGNLFVRTGVLPALQSIYVVVDSPDTAVAAAGPSIKYLQRSVWFWFAYLPLLPLLSQLVGDKDQLRERASW